MKKQFGKVLRRVRTSQRTRADRLRRLQMESLEGRRLLAADFMVHHNYIIAEDVNQDFRVTPIDALLVINELNRSSSRSLSGGEGEVNSERSGKLDVNGDGFITPIDALMVINRLNAEGEEHEFLVSYDYEITNPAGEPISNATVGETFRLNVFVRDPRGEDATGMFSAGMDLGITGLDVVEFVRDANFLSGFDFGDFYPAGRLAAEGGGLQLLGRVQPQVTDGDTFSLDSGSGPITFEFDWDDSVENGNEAIVIRNPSASDPPQPLGFNEVANAMVAAINGTDLGITAKNNGFGVIGIPLEEVSVDFGEGNNGPLGLSETSQEYFNEVQATSGSLVPPSDPTAPTRFYSVDFVATAEGIMTFNPNGPDLPGAENNIFAGGSNEAVPNEFVNFGSPFNFEILADPTAPVAIDDLLTTDEDTELIISDEDLIANDQVTEPRTLSVVSIDPIPGVTMGQIDGATYTPAPNVFAEDDLLTYTIEDSTGLRSTATVTISINAVNDPPIAVDDFPEPVLEESSDNVITGLLDNDSPGPLEEGVDSIRIVAVGNFSAGGSATFSEDGQAVIYTPDFNFIGTETFEYTIEDEGGLRDTATVTIEVEPLVLPRARNESIEIDEDTSQHVIDVLSNDRVNEGEQAILLGIASNPENGQVVIDDNGTPDDLTDDLILYTPDSNFFGTDIFTYTMNDTSDPRGEDSIGTVTVTVNNINDPPILQDDEATTDEDVVLELPISTLLENDSPGPGEEEIQTLTLTSVEAITPGGSVEIVGENVIYTPGPDFNGTFEFIYTAQDDGDPIESGTATVTITVNAINDPPIAATDFVEAIEDTTAAYNVDELLANDLPGPETAVDEADQELSITAVSSTSEAGGTVTLENGVVTYVPPADFFGSDSFTYTLMDEEGATDTGTVNIDVAAVNDPPIAGTDEVTAFADLPTVIQVATLLANDVPGPANESDQTLSIIEVNATTDTNGTVVLNEDGTITYTPDEGYIGPATFTYVVQDSGPGDGLNENTAVGTVEIEVVEFQPSTISGSIFVDENDNGEIDHQERGLGGVMVTLAGTSLGQTITPQAMITLADGSYAFDELGPGEYVVSMDVPELLVDGKDSAGSLGDSDDIENQFTIHVEAPGGFDARGYNFALQGIESRYSSIIDQLASSYMNPELIRHGASFGIGEDNSLKWGLLYGGFDQDVLFSEAVLSDDGRELFLTVVDANRDVYTATLLRGQFAQTQADSGSRLIRVLRSPASFDWELIDRADPPNSPAANYLSAVDAIFAQEEWDR